MQLVLLALQMIEEAAHAGEFVFPLDNHSSLFRVEFRPGDIERNIRLSGEALQLGKQRAVFGLGPGFDGALVQGLRLVRYDQVKIEVDGVAEALAPRAGAVRVVERKQAGFGFLVAQMASFALETLGETEPSRRLTVTRGGLKDDLAGLAIADFDGVHDAGAGVRGSDHSVHQQEDRLAEIDVEQRLWRGEFEDLVVLIEAVETALAQCGKTRF